MLIALFCGACGDDVAHAALVGYTGTPDSRNIIVTVESGPLDKVLDGVVVSQGSKIVQIDVPMRRSADTQPAIAIKHLVTLTLESPLGNRQVQTTTGRVVAILPN